MVSVKKVIENLPAIIKLLQASPVGAPMTGDLWESVLSKKLEKLVVRRDFRLHRDSDKD